MAGTIWLFIDEVGDANFGRNGSPYFGLASIATPDPAALSQVVDKLRHEWWSERHVQGGYFHAVRDCWEVRRAVIALFDSLPLARTDIVSLTKSNVHRGHRTPERLYTLAVEHLFAYVAPLLADADRLVVATAEWRPAVADLSRITREALATPSSSTHALWSRDLTTLQAPVAAHAGFQMADYVGWAGNRARTRGDSQWLQTVQANRASSDHTLFP